MLVFLDGGYYDNSIEINKRSYIYDRLVIVDEEQNFKPKLAESFEYSGGGRTITFKLRAGVKWHDGEPFTAEDVAFTYQATASGGYPNDIPAFAAFLEGYEEYHGGAADSEKLITRIAETAKKAGFSFRVINKSGPRYDDPESPLVKLLLKTANEFLHIDAKPYMMGGGTHARKLKNAIPYGPGYPREARKEGEEPKFGVAHGKDESVEIDRLLETIKIYVITLIRLDSLLE